jgi:c-di-GMP-binding flagellar brake protein YcgR
VTPVRILHERGVLDGRSEDVSTGGLLVVTQGDAAALHGATHVRFALPTAGKMVTLPVHVRWKREQPGRTAIGLEFYGLTPDVRDAIATYVKWLCAEG